MTGRLPFHETENIMKKFLSIICLFLTICMFTACEKEYTETFRIKGSEMTQAEATAWLNGIRQKSIEADPDKFEPVAYSVACKTSAAYKDMDYDGGYDGEPYCETKNRVSVKQEISGTVVYKGGEDLECRVDIKTSYKNTIVKTTHPEKDGDGEEAAEEGKEEAKPETETKEYTAEILQTITIADEKCYSYFNISLSDGSESRKVELRYKDDSDLDDISPEDGSWTPWQEDILEEIADLTDDIMPDIEDLPLADIIKDGGRVCKNGRGIGVEIAGQDGEMTSLLLLKCDFRKDGYMPKYMNIYNEKVYFDSYTKTRMDFESCKVIDIQKPADADKYNLRLK